jgi:hypothetical protein
MNRPFYNPVSEYERATALSRRHTLTLFTITLGALLSTLVAVVIFSVAFVTLCSIHSLPHLFLSAGCALYILVAYTLFFFGFRALLKMERRAARDARLAMERYERIARSVGNY